ncbi:hypothetical protein ABZP36_025082 [Zizania latifolia]
MAIVSRLLHPAYPLSTTPSPPCNTYLRFTSAPPLLRSLATSKPPLTPLVACGEHAALSDPAPAEPREKDPLGTAPLLVAVAVAAFALPLAAFAASGGSMGGCSSSSSSWDRHYPSYSFTHQSVGTAASPPVDARMQFWITVALAGVIVFAVWYFSPPPTTVVKLQVALRGVATAKSFQKDLNNIAEKAQTSDRRGYKFILAETISSLRRHKDCCISTSLSVDVENSWKDHFKKISLETGGEEQI